MNATTIEWTDYTWNPVTGCDKVSAGCRSCYAETVATRFWGDRKFTDVVCHHDRLTEPNKYRKKWHGKKVFVCSMSDLFHESVPFQFIYEVWTLFAKYRNTVFQVLTKRPERALEFFKTVPPIFFHNNKKGLEPLTNVWIGVSCENQEQADKRIPTLLQIPAAVRFLSCEPLLGAIDIHRFVHSHEYTSLRDGIHWVIAGGESGHMARPMHPDWVRSLRDQCAAANVPFFFKQWGNYAPYQFDRETTEPVRSKPEHHTFWKDKTGQRFELIFEDGDYLVACGKTSILGEPFEAVVKYGKSKAGNTLDGKQHLAFPSKP